MDDAEEILDDPDNLLECDEEDQLEQTFTNDPMIFFEGKLTSKQHVLNELINTLAGSAPRDRLMRALLMPWPGKLPTLTMTPQAENMPVAGGTFVACVCFQEEKLSLGIFYLWAVTNSSGHSTMDTPTSEIEGAAHLIVHGQFMPLEQYANAGLHVWHGRLHTHVLSFRGTSVQFIRMHVNEDNKWYAPTNQLDALSEWCAQFAPQTVPPLKCKPYEGLFVTDCGDKGLTTDISRPVQCKICEATVPRVCMRTHVGQHLLRKECVTRREEISLATTCGFCGDRVTCSTQVLMCNKRMHALVTLMLSDYPSQPAKLRWNTLAKKCASSPCTNQPVRCPLCTKIVWSCCMTQHYADVHDTARHPHLMQIADAEEEAVLNWVPHKAKKKKQPHVRQRPRVHPVTSLRRLRARLPSLCVALRLLPPCSQVSPRQRPLGLSDLVL